MTSGSIDFWKNPQRWPRDTDSHLFLGRAVDKVGRAIFGDEWTGKEPTTELMRYPPKERLKLIGGIPRSVQLTEKARKAALAIVTRDHYEQSAAALRFSRVRGEIIQSAEAGKLEMAVRAKVGGEFEPLPRSWWNSERLINRFHFCQLNPTEPFGIGSEGDKHQWIFVTRDSFELQFKSKEKQSSSVEQQCLGWLGQILSKPETERLGKAEFRKKAHDKFGTALAGRMFERCWGVVTAMPKNSHRKRAGAKKRSR